MRMRNTSDLPLNLRRQNPSPNREFIKTALSRINMLRELLRHTLTLMLVLVIFIAIMQGIDTRLQALVHHPMPQTFALGVAKQGTGDVAAPQPSKAQPRIVPNKVQGGKNNASIC